MEKIAIDLTKDQKQAKQASEVADLKRAEIDAVNGGDEMPTITANRNKKYKVRVIEQNYVHVLTITKHLDQAQKDFTIEEFIVKIHAREFDRRVAEGMFATFDEVEVIHDPRKDAPREYNLKPNQLEISANGPAPDKNIAVREKQLKAQEAKLATQFSELDASWKKEQDRLAAREKAIADKEAELDRLIAHANSGKNTVGEKGPDPVSGDLSATSTAETAPATGSTDVIPDTGNAAGAQPHGTNKPKGK